MKLDTIMTIIAIIIGVIGGIYTAHLRDPMVGELISKIFN